jgi:AraC family transcriptional regulator, alkane utilization regulator
MDVLSEVLRVVRLTGGIFFTTRFSAPWSVFSPPAGELGRLMHTRAECITLFHILLEGKCWFGLQGRQPFVVDKGTVVIFPHSPSHIMCSHTGLSSKPIVTLLPFAAEEGLPEIQHGGSGETTRFICGYLQCDQRFNPLIGALPDVLLISPRDSAVRKYAAEQDPALLPNILLTQAGDWMDTTLQYLIQETKDKRLGSATMMARLTELLFVETLRRYMQQLPAESDGWMAGIRHPEVGRCLHLLHAQPGKKWTMRELALAVGMSRSALAQRFTDLIGEPPIHYLTRWRMQLAKNLMLQPDLSISSIAAQIGYDSDEAFNRAFKRYIGEPPVSWRNHTAP